MISKKVGDNTYMLNVSCMRVSRSLTKILVKFWTKLFSVIIPSEFVSKIFKSLSLMIPGRLQY